MCKWAISWAINVRMGDIVGDILTNARLVVEMVKKMWSWYSNLPNRIRDSAVISLTIVGLISTILTIVGVSLTNLTKNGWLSLVLVIVLLVIVFESTYMIIGCIFKDYVKIKIRNTEVEVSAGDIFDVTGFKVIGCDTHFDTRCDDVVISKTSLHGQLVLEHGKKEEIEAVVEAKATALGLTKNSDGLYDFPLGTIIRYDSSVDGQTYLMLALTEIRKEQDRYKAFTSMQNYEQMLRRMWDEIDGTYVYYDIALPLLGTGISRFEGGKSKDALLRCMLCTLYSSGIDFTSKVRIVIYGNAEDIPLYEYKEMFRTVPGKK